MLLGSPPDTVHGATLRGTGLSSLLIQGRRYILRPGAGIHPCCSGLQVQGTAVSPTSAALLHAEAGADYYVFYYILSDFAMIIFKGCFGSHRQIKILGDRFRRFLHPVINPPSYGFDKCRCDMVYPKTVGQLIAFSRFE